MLIECLIKRPGGSHIDLDGVQYHFKSDAADRHTADVLVDAHVDRFLSISDAYRVARAMTAPAAAVGIAKPAPQSGHANTVPQVIAAATLTPKTQDPGPGPAPVSAAENAGTDAASVAPAESDDLDTMTEDQVRAEYASTYGTKARATANVETLKAKIRAKRETAK